MPNSSPRACKVLVAARLIYVNRHRPLRHQVPALQRAHAVEVVR